MNKYFCVVSSLSLLVLATFAPTASAANVTTFADIDTWVGFGDNEAALVLDWNDGHEPGIWGYRFDGPKTSQDMLLEIVADQPDLFARVGAPGDYGIPVYGIGYNRNGGSFGISDDVSDESYIFNGSTIAQTDEPDFFDGPATSNDPGDSYHEGWWSGGFFSFWISSGRSADGGWDSSFVGASDRVIADGDWDGFSYVPSFTITDPPSVLLTVPEPSSAFALLAVGAFASGRRQRRSSLPPASDCLGQSPCSCRKRPESLSIN